jgi:hypothetical protein
MRTVEPARTRAPGCSSTTAPRSHQPTTRHERPSAVIQRLRAPQAGRDIADLQRTIGNQAVARRMPAAAGDAPRPWSGAVQTRMESAFQADFSAVRIHEGPHAASLGALAYTRGDDIHFAPGRYDPGSAAGQAVLGHELAHVVQQRAGRVPGPDGVVREDRGLEAEADRAASHAVGGRPARVDGGSSGLAAGSPSRVIQRMPMVPNAEGARDDQNHYVLEDAATWDDERAIDWRIMYRNIRDSPTHLGHDWQAWSDAYAQVWRHVRDLTDPAEDGATEDELIERDKKDLSRRDRANELIREFQREQGVVDDYAFAGVAGQQQALGNRLLDLVVRPHRLNQVDYGFCGANAFLHSVATTEPETFVRYMLAMIRTGRGTLGVGDAPGLRVKASREARRKIGTDIDPIDWIAMAGLRSSENKVLGGITRMSKDGDGKPRGLFRMARGGLQGYSTVGDLKSWYRKLGYTVLGHLDRTIMGLSRRQLTAAGDAWSVDTEVTLYIPGSAVHGEFKGRPSHFVRLASKVREQDGALCFKVWSWGEMHDLVVPLADVSNAVYGYVIAQAPHADPGDA